MMTFRLGIALFSAAFLGAACAANDGHVHKHGSSTTKAVTPEMKKAAPAAGDAAMKPMAGKGEKKMADSGAAMAQGKIKRVNKSAKKLTIKHGEIKNLDMPPMTMVFKVADDAMLDSVKKGDDVMFHVEDRGGAMVITEIKPAK